jgi:hypothetical protein
MGTEIITYEGNQNAVSFADKQLELSDGQRNLMELLTNKIGKNEPITQSDIMDCYFKSVSKDGKTIRVRSGMGWNGQFRNTF